MLLGRTATFVRFLVYFQEGKVKGASSSGVIGMQGGNLKLSQQQVLNLRGKQRDKAHPPRMGFFLHNYTGTGNQKKMCLQFLYISRTALHSSL